MKTLERFTSSTPKGCEGHNISRSSEMECAKQLLAKLPKSWSVHFDWCQILFSDVQYQVDKKKKLVEIQYNQNLTYWFPSLVKDVITKI